MPKLPTVTQSPTTPSQPGWGVSVIIDHSAGTYRLSVSRCFDHLPNAFGGKGVFRRGDADGMYFPSREAAWAFALSRGYLQEYFPRPAGIKRHCRALPQRYTLAHMIGKLSPEVML